MSSRTTLLACALILTVTASGAGQPPRLANANVDAQVVSGALESHVRTLAGSVRDVAWIGYAVPVVDSERVMCCFNSGSGTMSGTVYMRDAGDLCCAGCSLESGLRGTASVSGRDDRTAIKLEGSTDFLVMYRVEKGQVGRIRVFSEDCPIDAGGRPVHWLTGVKPPDSVALLASYAGVGQEPPDRLTDSAITAIALHADPAADSALDRFVAPDRPASTRRKAAFWMTTARGRRGFETLRRMVRDDPSDDFRKHAVFALSQSKQPETIDTIIGLARTDRDTRVRGEALFWLSQTAGQKAAATLTEAIDRDPETEVKKKAVFALSQLPKEEGVPLLIQVARTNKNPAVRKQAIFWLGQSKDERALKFFEEILTK